MIRPVFQRKLDSIAEQSLLLAEREIIDSNLAKGRKRIIRNPSEIDSQSSWYTADEEMPLRMTMKTRAERRNATVHANHRMSLMKGILSVANGEGESPAAEFKSQSTLPRYLSSGEDANGTYRLPEAAFKPLPDPDEYYQKKTYVVVNKQGVIFRFTEAKALFLFDKKSKIRQSAINLFIHPLFSLFIMLVIIANCICMMFSEPPPIVENYLEYVFTAIYSFEALIKIIGHGFVLHRFTYLRDYWNWLDFIVIMSAYITEILKAAVSESALGQLSVLRAFRVLRALKTMSVVPGLRGIVKALLRSIHALKDAVVLTMFCLSVFALIGYQLFHGTMKNKCVREPGTSLVAPDAFYAVHLANESFVPVHINSKSLDEFNYFSYYYPWAQDPSVSPTSSQTSGFNLYPIFKKQEFFYERINRSYNETLVFAKDDLSDIYRKTGRLIWTKDDSYIIGNITKVLNETEQEFNFHNSSFTHTCQDIQQCVTVAQTRALVRQDSLILQMESDVLEQPVQQLWRCDYVNNTFALQYNVSLEYKYEFEYEEMKPLCNVSIYFQSADLECLRNVLPNITEKCSGDIWAPLYQHFKDFVDNKEAQKSIVIMDFDEQPLPYEEVNNNKSMLIFYREFLRENLTDEGEQLWDDNSNNYVMQSLNPSAYYYTDSANIPSQEPKYCIIDEGMCPAGFKCREAGANPDNGFTNFDHFFWSFLTSFRLIAQDAWSRLYYLTLHTIGKGYVIFYILIMFLGSYYLINLILAVVYMAYEEQQAVVEEEELEAREREEEKREQQMKAQALADGKHLPIVDTYDNGGHSESDLIQPQTTRYKHFKRRHWRRHNLADDECTCDMIDHSLESMNYNRQSIYSHTSTISECSCSSTNQDEGSESSQRSLHNKGQRWNSVHNTSRTHQENNVEKSLQKQKLTATLSNPEKNSVSPGMSTLAIPDEKVFVFPDDTDETIPPRRKSILRKNSASSEILKRNGEQVVQAEVTPNVTTKQPLLVLISPSTSNLNMNTKNENVPHQIPTVLVTSESKDSFKQRNPLSVHRQQNNNLKPTEKQISSSCVELRDAKGLLDTHHQERKKSDTSLPIQSSIPFIISQQTSRGDLLYDDIHRERSVSFCDTSDVYEPMELHELTVPSPVLKKKRFEAVKEDFINYCAKWNCCSPFFLKIQLKLRLFVLDPFMDLFITLCIALNTIFLMMDKHPMDDWFQDMLETANLIFTGIFACEMVLKIIGLTPYFYFKERWNVFDATIVIFSLLELLLQTVQGLSVLRTFRLLRILKLAKAWPTLNKLLVIIGRTVGKLWHLTCVFLLVLFIFAVVGMQLLRADYKAAYGDNMPRWNFYDFKHAFMVVFRIQCGEWIENMFTCMTISRPSICIPLFILVYIIGNLVILNLFLALLLNSFSGDALQRTESETNSISLAIARLRKGWLYIRNSVASSQFLSHCCNKLHRQILPRNDSQKPSILDMQLKHVSSNGADLHSRDDSTTATTGGNITSITAISSNKQDHENNNSSDNDIQRKMSTISKADSVAIAYINKSRSLKKHHNPSCKYHPCNRTHVPGCKMYKASFTSISCSLPNVTKDRNGGKKHRPGFAPASEFANKPDDGELGNLEPISRTVSADPQGRGKYPSPTIQRNYSKNLSIKSQSTDSRRESIFTEENESINKSRKSSKNSLLERKDLVNISIEEVSENDDLKSPLIIANLSEETLNKKNESKNHESAKHSRMNGDSHKNSSKIQSKSSSKSFQSKSEQGEKTEEKPKPDKVFLQKLPYCFPNIWPNENIESGKWKEFRSFFNKIVTHRYFENVVIFCILLSSVALAFEDVHLHKRPKMKRILDILDVFFCVFFAIEMILKWIGLGIRCYFTNYWCWLDFFIVSLSVSNLILSAAGFTNLGALRVLRTFRAFRPLRALSRFQGMKVVVDALFRAIPSIGQVFLVCMIFWLIFSILGVNLFAGRFGRCVSMSTKTILPYRSSPGPDSLHSATNEHIAQCYYNQSDAEKFMKLERMNELGIQYVRLPAVKNMKECLACAKMLNTTDIIWDNPSVNFDNVLHGYLALLQVATFKGWLEIMNNAIDITGKEEQPNYEVSFFYYVYFLVFIVCGAFFSLNLFIGVIIDNFNEQKKDSSGGEGGGVFLTDEQRKYYNAMKKMSSKTPSKPIPRPSSVFANKIYDIVTDRKFEIVVMGLILLNMVVMAIEHHNMDKKMNDILQYFNMAFIGIFIVEAVLKLIGLRLYYFTVMWNVFDLVVVIVSLVASALSDLVAQYFLQPTLLRIIRLFRVTRILRLIREAKGIRTLLFALMMSLPALFNIGTLLFLVVFIFAILGMSQFAYVQKVGGVDELLNFETFPNSFLVLFQVSTSEGWNTFLQPILQDQPPFCDPTIENPGGLGYGNCGNYTLGTIYFITFVLMTFLIVINMYIAIILENFEVATRESAEPLTADDFEQFFEVWQRYDDRLTQYISFEQLQDLLHHLDFPLRVPYPNTAFIAQAEMKISMDGKIHCLEVVIALIKKVLGDPPELNQFKETMLDSFKLKSGAKETVEYEDSITTMEFLQRLRAAVTIQRYYRQYLQREAMKAEELEEENYADEE